MGLVIFLMFEEFYRVCKFQSLIYTPCELCLQGNNFYKFPVVFRYPAFAT